jgi:hypothetical protein
MVPSLKFAAVPNRTAQRSCVSFSVLASVAQVWRKRMSFEYADTVISVLSCFGGAFPNSVTPTCIELFVTKQFSEQGFGDTIW